MEPPALAKYRAAFLDAKKSKELTRTLGKLEKAKMTFEAASKLKTAPRSLQGPGKHIDPDHPRADLLKLKGLVAMFPEFPAALVKKRALLDWLVDRSKLAAPLVRWLAHECR